MDSPGHHSSNSSASSTRSHFALRIYTWCEHSTGYYALHTRERITAFWDRQELSPNWLRTTPGRWRDPGCPPHEHCQYGSAPSGALSVVERVIPGAIATSYQQQQQQRDRIRWIPHGTEWYGGVSQPYAHSFHGRPLRC